MSSFWTSLPVNHLGLAWLGIFLVVTLADQFGCQILLLERGWSKPITLAVLCNICTGFYTLPTFQKIRCGTYVSKTKLTPFTTSREEEYHSSVPPPQPSAKTVANDDGQEGAEKIGEPGIELEPLPIVSTPAGPISNRLSPYSADDISPLSALEDGTRSDGLTSPIPPRTASSIHPTNSTMVSSVPEMVENEKLRTLRAVENLDLAPAGPWGSYLIGLRTSPLVCLNVILMITALAYLTVPTADLMASFSTLVSYVLSVNLKREINSKLNTAALAGMLLCSFYVYQEKPVDLVTGDEADTLAGYSIGITSAVIFGTLSVIINHIGDPYSIGACIVDDNCMFTGQAMGSAVLSVPILLVVHMTGLEKLEFPHLENWVLVLFLVLILNPVSILSLNKASIRLSPVIVQLAGAADGPVTVLIDHLRGAHDYPTAYVLGMLGNVCCSFVICVTTSRNRQLLINSNIERYYKMSYPPPCPPVSILFDYQLNTAGHLTLGARQNQIQRSYSVTTSGRYGGNIPPDSSPHSACRSTSTVGFVGKNNHDDRLGLKTGSEDVHRPNPRDAPNDVFGIALSASQESEAFSVRIAE